MIEIRHINGTVFLQMEIPEGASVHRELMGDHYVRLPFSLASNDTGEPANDDGDPVYFRMGDYCVIEGFGRFELTELYSPKYNAATAGFDFELRLDAYYIKWKNRLCKYLPLSGGQETSFKLTAAIQTHLSVIVDNINAIGATDESFRYNGSEFGYMLSGFPDDKKGVAKYKLYDGTDIISALNDLATLYDCEWWVEDNIIHFGRLGGDYLNSDEEPVRFDITANVTDMSRSEGSQEYANRIYAFGSERNLPANYRQDETTPDITVDGIVQKRLMLPKKIKLGLIETELHG